MDRKALIRLAEDWAVQGVPVFPTTRSKTPLAGTNGFKDSTNDPRKVSELFNSGEHVGLWPGPAGYVVLDIDVKDGKVGDQSLRELEEELGALPETVRYDTPSGGWHLWFKKPEGASYPNSEIARHIDVRADGGYVIAYGRPFDPEQVAALPEAYVARLGTMAKKVEEYDEDKLDDLTRKQMHVLMDELGWMPLKNGLVHGTEWDKDAYHVRLGKPGRPYPVATVGYLNPGVVFALSGDPSPLGAQKAYDPVELEKLLGIEPEDWPKVGNEAFYGPIGELASLVNVYEADKMFLLVTLLTTLSVMVGPGPSTNVGPIRQSGSLFAVMVGDSASGKGGSWGAFKPLLQMIDPDFFSGQPMHVVGGFGSGEIVVKTAASLTQPAEDKGDGTYSIPKNDTRMLIKESEFAKLLRITQRKDSVLGQIMCDAFDGEPLQHRTMKNDKPLIALDHHIGVLAHITPQELDATLTSLEAANGFGNRFLWVLGKSSGHVPFSADEFDYTPEELAELSEEELAELQDIGGLPEYDMVEARRLIEIIQERLQQAAHKRYRLSPTAAKRFKELEAVIVSDKPGGLAEPLIARGRVHFIRMALVYAIMDGSTFIREAHLEAAFAVWMYCRDSVVRLWKDKQATDYVHTNPGSFEDKVKAKLLEVIEAAGEGGIKKTDAIAELPSKRRSAVIAPQLLTELEKEGHIVIQTVKTGTRGAPPQMCIAVKHQTNWRIQ